MKPSRWIIAVLAGASLFAGGYVLGQTSNTIVPALDKQPVTMLSLGVVSANAELTNRWVSVRGDKLVVRSIVTTPFGPKRPAQAECVASLEGARDGLAHKTPTGRATSGFSLNFLSATERSLDTRATQEKRDAIDAATIVRIEYSPGGGGCEGPLKTSDVTHF